jgi:hypothetical protein
MHHMTKKSLLAKYEPMMAAGKSAVEIKNAIVESEQDKELTMEEVDEIVFELFAEDTVQPQSPKPPITNINEASNTEGPAVPKGKKLYDIYAGQWWATKVVTGYDGKDHVIEWEFRPEGKPRMTNVPCEPHRAEEFNAGKRLRAAKTPTEQMIDAGAENKIIIDRLPNPNEARAINQ